MWEEVEFWVATTESTDVTDRQKRLAVVEVKIHSLSK